ncbi:MAG: MFS transporter [Muribaculaceae bacterium]|nr:MFS transporter [Muribaculaceae bacterium]
MQNINTMPLTWRHIFIVTVASLGQLIGTAVATVAGVIIPMMNILAHPELSTFMQGLIGCVDLIGIAIGSVIFGSLSDKYGYLFFFRFCPALILAASLVAIFVPNVTVLTVALFVVGLGIGGEYSLDSGYVSVLMPVKYRALMVGVTKTASALGNIIAAGVCFWIIMDTKNAADWNSLMWIVAAIAALMLVLRIRFYESPNWLLAHGKVKEAEKAVQDFLGKDVMIPVPDTQTPGASPTPQKGKASGNTASDGLFSFIFRNGKRVILSGVPWACEGLGVYGIGVFLPILVMALGLQHTSPGEPEIFHVASSVEITLYISCIMLPGFIIGLRLINKNKSITAIQSVGFWLCALSLLVLLLSYHLHWNKWISIGAFMGFELFLNMGPHLITYVLPPKVYPVETRGEGVGIAAAIGKIGAVLGVFFIPVLLKAGGAMLVLIVSIAVMAAGAIVTNIYGHLVHDQENNKAAS